MVLVHALDEWRKAARISRGAGLISCEGGEREGCVVGDG